MRIQGRCETCGRDFLLSQIGPESDAPGRCPFCGARFARHYSTVLVEAVAETELSVRRFVQALRRLRSMETGFHMDVDGLLRELESRIREHDEQVTR